jgi:type VI protein secretion system component Hcp
MPSAVSREHRSGHSIVARSAAATLALILCSGAAWAYVGESYLQVPGIAGGWAGQNYNDWIKLEAQYWTNAARPPGFVPGPKRQHFSGPVAPREGAGTLALALDKHSPALKPLMERCHSGTRIAEVKYAESADLARPPGEAGPRMSTMPAFFEYSLKDVSLSCPIVADAPEQAFVVSFNEIKWLNYDGHGEDVKPVAATLIRGQTSGQTKSFIITWFAGATDVSDDQCPVLNAGPTEAEYYALMSTADAAKVKAQVASKGGVFQTPEGPLFRGPDRLNACKLPGIMRDPGHAAPQSKIARGFNLDGDEGAGAPRSGVRRHQNYVSEDGRTGIDNQYFSTIGCIPGFKRKGLLTMSHMEFVRTGAMSLIVEVSGIDSTKKVGNVDVTLLYSKDPMVRNATGTQILPRYTFRVTDDPALAQYFVRVHGRMENGVITTDPAREITIEDGGSIRLTLYDARLRLELQPDGTLKGILGGYEDWREIFNAWGPSFHFEQGMSFRCPAFYNALKQAADGLRDPASGEYHGISSAYDLEGIPAFIPPEQHRALLAQAKFGDHKKH